jgi:glycerol-3-phosphate dehydrogenase (NAD(P)+)
MSIGFAVLGDGAWGTAIALLLAQDPNHDVRLWSAREENARVLKERRENVRLLPGVPIPPSVNLTGDIREAVAHTDLWIVAVPTIYLRETLTRIQPDLPADGPILSLTKGVEMETFLRPIEIVRQILGNRGTAVLSGPSHAEEVGRGLPASLVVASDELTLARRIQEWFSSDRFRVYTSSDVTGVELGGALKNIIGIAAGISDGLGLGDNAKSALMIRGIVEIARFGVARGAERTTFYGLAGLGDLITTCVSRHGRNRHVGERLARGERLPEILASMRMVAEGIFTTRSVYERASQLRIEMPITTEVYQVLYAGKDPRAAVNDLMTREPKSE